MIGEDYESPLKETVGSTILGNSDFVKKICKKYLPESKDKRNVPAFSKLSKNLSLQEIESQVQAVFSNEPKLSRKASLYLSHRYSGRRLKDIGNYFGLAESAVSQASSRFALQVENEPGLRQRIEEVNRELDL